jgi:hypothetical protein
MNMRVGGTCSEVEFMTKGRCPSPALASHISLTPTAVMR